MILTNIFNINPLVSININMHMIETLNIELDHDVINVQTTIGKLKNKIDIIIKLIDEIIDYKVLTESEKQLVYKLLLEYIIMYIDDRNGIEFDAYIGIIYINILEDLRNIFKSDILDNELSHKDKTFKLIKLENEIKDLFSSSLIEDFFMKLELLRDVEVDNHFLDDKKYITPYLKNIIISNNNAIVNVLFIYII